MRPGSPVRLGLRENAAQFTLLVAVNALVGAMIGLERSTLPLIGEREFGITSSSAVLAFVVAFGIAKACTNLVAGSLAERLGRRRILIAGWLAAIPVPVMIGLAPSWWVVVAANVLLGINQGLAWSMTVVMKIDLAGPRRRGLALGLNEAAGYLGLAVTAFASGAIAASHGPRTVVWVGGSIVAGVALTVTALFVRDTAVHVALEQRDHGRSAGAPALTLGGAVRHGLRFDPVLRACHQAGLVNNLNDALAWGLIPLYLAARGASISQVAAVAGIYPLVWGAGQLVTGWASDHVGRRWPIAGGMVVQAAALMLLVAGDGRYRPAILAAVLLGAGTAMVYPTLLAAVSDASEPRDRTRHLSVYRFFRDAGFAVGAVIVGVAADLLSAGSAILIVAALTALSGLVVAVTPWHPAATTGSHGPPVVPVRGPGTGLDG